MMIIMVRLLHFIYEKSFRMISYIVHLAFEEDIA